MGGIQFGIYSLPDTIAEINNLVTQISTGLTDLEGNLNSKIDTIGSRLELVQPVGDILYTSPETTKTGDGYNTCFGGRFFIPKTGIYNVKVYALEGIPAAYKLDLDKSVDSAGFLSSPVNTVIYIGNMNSYKQIVSAQYDSGDSTRSTNVFAMAGEVIFIVSQVARGYMEIRGDV